MDKLHARQNQLMRAKEFKKANVICCSLNLLYALMEDIEHQMSAVSNFHLISIMIS